MANKIHAFKDRDLKRIIRSVEAATGKAARRIEVDPKSGRCSVEVGDTIITGNSWDEVLSNATNPKRPT